MMLDCAATGSADAIAITARTECNIWNFVFTRAEVCRSYTRGDPPGPSLPSHGRPGAGYGPVVLA
jgi:hypothetical protein